MSIAKEYPMRQLFRLLWVLFVALEIGPLAWAWPEERPAQYKFTCKEVQIPMRDAVKLAADLYLPEGPGPFGVIVERTPYDMGDCQSRNAIYFAERGFAV